MSSLTAKLAAALAALEGGNTGAAVNQLGAFINEVGALVRSRRLSEAEGASLIAAAQAVLDQLTG